MGVLRAHFSYAKLNKEDPEEMQHLKASFLIHKMLEEAEAKQRRSHYARLRVFRVKRKIGVRLRRLRVAISKARLCACYQISKQLRHLKLVLLAS